MSRPSAIQASRPQDYLYDTLYTVSSRKDHMKCIDEAKCHQVLIVPHYNNMFAKAHNYPSAHLELRPYKTVIGLGHDRVPISTDPMVLSTNRLKYYKRPMVPFLSATVVYARKQLQQRDAMSRQQTTAGASLEGAVRARTNSPFIKNVSVQTMFRESEAQTDPYSPEYVLRQGVAYPELLALATLSYSKGLPAGLAEVEMIERARIKRAWEATLPEVTDQDSFERRLKMMEEMELKEWAERENEIKRLQEARLAILSKLIRKREYDNEHINNERIEKIWQRKLQERDALHERIQKRRAKALRKLAERRKFLQQSVEKRDIISEYCNYGSKVYAPLAREGVFKDSAAMTLQAIPPSLISPRNAIELEALLPRSVVEPDLSLPKKPSYFPPEARRDRRLQEQLKFMDAKIKERKNVKKMEEKPLKYCFKIEQPLQRPPTPATEDDNDLKNDLAHSAALLLQNLIRGRVVQNRMYQGKQRRLTLISELRARQMITQAEVDIAIEKSMSSMDSIETVNLTELREPTVAEVHIQDAPTSTILPVEVPKAKPVALKKYEQQEECSPDDHLHRLYEMCVQGEFIGQTLDFISKEIVRLREERRISAMVKLAERIRRMRESEESGRRQEELRRRIIEDEVFRQIVAIHNETVDSYLEGLILQSTRQLSSIQAREQVRSYADKISSIVDQIHQGDEDLGVADLVSSFLIPEVERETLREKVLQEQKKYLLAVHKTIHEGSSEVEQKVAHEKMIQEAQDKATFEEEMQKARDARKVQKSTLEDNLDPFAS